MPLSALHPEVARRLRRWQDLMRLNRVPFRITSLYRDPVKQERLFRAWIARGRTGLPAAAPGCSTHEYGFAFDAVVAPGIDREIAAALAAHAGFAWFGPRDPVHFDVFGRSWLSLIRSTGRC